MDYDNYIEYIDGEIEKKEALYDECLGRNIDSTEEDEYLEEE